MSADTPHPGEDRDPRDGAAAILPVTDAMMDHAAHEAAALADGVAHGTVAVGTAADETADAAAEAARNVVEAAGMAANDAAERAGDGLSASADALTRYNAKVVEVLHDGAAATTALFAALIQARSVPEALSINAEHLRRRTEALASQGRELANLAQTVVLDALQLHKGKPDR